MVDKTRHGVAAILRPLAVAMPAQIGLNDVPAVAKPLHHPVPAARMVAGAMDQQQLLRLRIAAIEIMQAQALRDVGVRGRAWHGHLLAVARAIDYRKTAVSRSPDGAKRNPGMAYQLGDALRDLRVRGRAWHGELMRTNLRN